MHRPRTASSAVPKKQPVTPSIGAGVGQACQAALFDYIDAMSFSSGALARIAAEGPADLNLPEVIDMLARSEEEARQAYAKARAALIGYVLSTGQAVKA